MLRSHSPSWRLPADPSDMNIHEYQAKQLFQRFNVATPKGAPAETPEEAEKIAAAFKASELVVKAQIHAGGRGKGTFTNGFKGGGERCTTPAEARELAEKLLGQTLVHPSDRSDREGRAKGFGCRVG